MLKVNRKFFANLLRDPGIMIALGNVFLFSHNGGTSFLFVSTVFTLIVLSKIGNSLQKNNFLNETIKKFLQKRYAGLIIAGYGCFGLAVLSFLSKSVHGFVCGITFGLANLVLADRFESHEKQSYYKSNDKFNDIPSECPISHSLEESFGRKKIFFNNIFLNILKEPIVLVSVGMISSGLFAGGSTVVVLPIALLPPILIISRPEINRGIPQAIFAIVSISYLLVAIFNEKWLSVATNICYTIAYLMIASKEHQMHK